MTDHTVEFLDQLPPSLENKMHAGHVEYEKSHGINVNYKRFALVLKEHTGNVIAVLCAYTAFAEIYVDDLWVDAPHRGKGYGKHLLYSLENHFKRKGFNNINLVTNAFQAPEFYKKCGFSIEFTRLNLKNPQLTKTFFVKYFDEEVQTQGLLQV
jgi:ribosomal protein S18 acetylase RimI-like enzyme